MKIKLLIVLCCFLTWSITAATATAEDAPSAATDYSSELWGDLSNSDGSIVRIPLMKTKIEKVRQALDNLKRGGALVSIKAVVSEASAVPCVILLGNPDDVNMARKIVEFVLREQMSLPKYLLDIQVNLRSYNKKEFETIGVNLFPVIKNIQLRTGGSSEISRNNGDITSDIQALMSSATADISISNIDLNSTDNLGQVLVSGEMVTDNGTMIQLANILREPTLLTVNGDTSTVYQTLTSKVNVTPTIISFDANNPLNTQVKLDLAMKIAVNTGTVQLAGTQAPTYSVKSLTTNRVFKADGKHYFAGTFVSDYMVKGTTYIPILGEIPILKYLFSQESDQLTSKTSILFICVRLIPTGF